MKFKNIAIFAFLVFSYFISGKLGLSLAVVNPNATAIWAPTGIAIAGILIFGQRFWPAIFLAAFLTNITTTEAIASSLGIAIGNTLEGIIAAYLISLYADGRKVFDSPRGIFKFIIIIFLSCVISASWGVASLLFEGSAAINNYKSIWFTWWMGDVSGAIIITPLFLFWTKRYLFKWNKDRFLEAVYLLLTTVIVAGAVFHGTFFNIPDFLPIEFLIIPILVWIALRFDRRETITAILILALIAIWGTYQGHGPFSGYNPNESLILLQSYLDIVTIMILSLAAVVAERKRVSRLFQSTLDNMTEGFQIIGFDYKYLYVNEAVAQQGKKKPEELLDHTMVEIYPEIEKTEMFGYLKKCMIDRVPHEMDNKFTYPDGSQKWFRLKIEPITEGALILSIDITKEREVDVMKTEFIFMASHELRTPLSAIKGFVSMISSGDYGKLNKKLQRPFYLVASSTDRLINIVNEMLDVSRIDAGRVMLSQDTHEINKLIEESVSVLKPLILQKKLKLSVVRKKRINIYADKNKVIQILNNLIGNAIKFTDKGSIDLRVEQIKDKVIVYVADSGQGIISSDQAKLFNKFEQLRSKKEGRVSGTGLGLYISREFARKMGGDLWIVQSEPGKGSTFALSIPSRSAEHAKKE
jgi:PAS domain S-box-containing protein